jgi:hypothetical protein
VGPEPGQDRRPQQAVETQGPLAARVGGIASGRLRFALLSATAPFSYGVYVGYDHHPTATDAAALAATGAPVQVRYENIDYIRTQVTMTQALAIASLPGVTRIETIPALYAVNDIAARTQRARDSGGALFPSVWANAGHHGQGRLGRDPRHRRQRRGRRDLSRARVAQGQVPRRRQLLCRAARAQHAARLEREPEACRDPEVTYHGTHVAGTAIGSGGRPGSWAAPRPASTPASRRTRGWSTARCCRTRGSASAPPTRSTG